MGAPKQKWTAEEEAALRAGVDKYGPGKWRAIQNDDMFGSSLAARSNVDLKDKWRNMSVSANGFGSRDKAAKILALKIGATPAIGTLSVNSVVKQRKPLGTRYDNFVFEAILSSEDSNGCDKNYISSYVEAHHPVSSNFRRSLTSKLTSLTLQGKLIKIRQNYTISETIIFPLKEKTTKNRSRKQFDQLKPQFWDSNRQNNEVQQMPTFARDPMKMIREFGSVKLKVDADSSRCKTMTAAEAAKIAAQAVAEAEVAAAAAEEAAKAAEVAEAEWEAAEAAAAAATALGAESPRESVRTLPAAGEDATVPG